MPQTTTAHHLIVRNGDVSLGGTLWLPVDPGGVTVLMHPGSGPSDRDNDVFFPPIRQYLLECGITVSSFDKRGVGDSTGRWQEAAIEEQASDAIACLEALRADTYSKWTCRQGDPPALVGGYLETLASFILAAGPANP
jgi:pimeloyl-ACP methyl ester carboxylesterase